MPAPFVAPLPWLLILLLGSLAWTKREEIRGAASTFFDQDLS